jgi:hypothetical protein
MIIKMAKRSYNRRSDEQLIQDLQDKIHKVETRMKAKQREDAAVLKELPKVNRALRRFSQLSEDHGRSDLSNMTLAFLAGLERSAKELPESATPKPRSRREEPAADK